MSHDRHLTIYRSLSALYPRSFRDAYREDLAVLFSHQITDEPALRVWLRTIRDLAVTVPVTHLEARMNRPPTRVLVGIGSILTAASVATALMIGTGAPGATIVLLAIAVVSGSVSAWAWHADQTIHDTASPSSAWWKLLSGGLILIVATFTSMAIPWPDAADLGDNAYWLIVASIMTGLMLAAVGLLLGIATLIRNRRSGPIHGTT